jgi:hypothetical protein
VCTQVIRLPKPPAEEWPRRPGQGRHRADNSDASSADEEEEEIQQGRQQRKGSSVAAAAGGAADAAVGSARAGIDPEQAGPFAPSSAQPGTSAPPLAAAWVGVVAPPAHDMSAAHRVGLAKCASAVEWLDTQLGMEGQGEDVPAAVGDEGAGAAVRGEPPVKFIVFAHHRDVMNRLAAALDVRLSRDGKGRRLSHRFNFVRIDGDTDGEGRRQAEEDGVG